MNSWIKTIEDDLNWREAELASLKKLVIEAQKPSVRYTTLLRAMCALLYAHYEGFCKFLWDYYLDVLEKQKIKRVECNSQLTKLSLQKDFKTLKGDLSLNSIWDFCNKRFSELLEHDINFEMKLETQNNLWPNVLTDNLTCLGLDYSVVTNNETKLKNLVSRRNNIAHGQKMIIKDLDEYQKYEDAVFNVIYELAFQIEGAISRKQYLKNV